MVMDKFFTQKHCNRCRKDLEGGRSMSKFNETASAWHVGKRKGMRMCIKKR